MSVAHVLGKLVGFLRSTHNDDCASRGESSLWVDSKKTTNLPRTSATDFHIQNK